MALGKFSPSGTGTNDRLEALQRLIMSRHDKVSDLINTLDSIDYTATTGTDASESLLANYRKGSIALPRYYENDSIGRVASMKIIRAIEPNYNTAEAKNNEDLPIELDSKLHTNFLLKHVSENFQEQYQIVDTFGDDYGVFFTGETPKIFTFQGILINDTYRKWKSKFINFYMTTIRGSELARDRLKVSITYDYVNVEGYIFGLRCDIDGTDDITVPFTFSMLITKYEDLALEEPDAGIGYGGQLGAPLHQAESQFTGITGSLSDAQSEATSFLPLKRGIDRLVARIVPQASVAELAKGKILESNLSNLKNIQNLPPAINEATSIVAATSDGSFPSMGKVLDTFSTAITGNLGDVVDLVEEASGAFLGNTSPAQATVSKFTNLLKNVTSGNIPSVLNVSSNVTANLGNNMLMSQAKELLNETGIGNLANMPTAQVLQKVINDISGNAGRNPAKSYTVNYKKLFDTIASNKDDISDLVSQSFKAISGSTVFKNVENIQGLKLLSEAKDGLFRANEAISRDADFHNVKAATTKLIEFLRTGYVLIGSQR